MKQLSRKAFMLMLRDDSGEVSPIQLDVAQVNSDNAIIVLDEYNDTCWVWIGRSVNMPTRMHALRIARGLQKSGFKIGVTTIGLSTSRFVEMMEKDDTDPDIASSIVSFRGVLDERWSFDDKVLAFKKDTATDTATAEPIAGAPTKKYVPDPEPELTLKAETIREEPVSAPAPPPTPPPEPSRLVTMADKKAAYLMLAISKNSDIVYTERFERGGDTGLKIEVPGVMVIEALMRGNQLSISPGDFGGSEAALKIKSEFTDMVKKL
jgi:hypothetical protein